MYLDLDEELLQQFEKVLDTPPPPGRQKEQVVQDFLEAYTELIPTPSTATPRLHLDAIVSKFKLSTDLTTDYIYMNANSAFWELTLVELEVPDEPFFTNNRVRANPTSEFTAALAQVREWRIFMEDHQKEVLDRLAPLMRGGLQNNKVIVRYQLIYGRSKNKNRSDATKKFISDVREKDGIDVISYDTLINSYRSGAKFSKNVLRQAKRRFAFKSMLERPGHFFAHMGPDDLDISEDQFATLNAHGYQMDAWKDGQLLVFNTTHPMPSREELQRRNLEVLSRPRSEHKAPTEKGQPDKKITK